jgi:hypothetical protein
VDAIRRCETQLEQDLVNRVRVARVLAGCAFVKGPDVILTLGGSGSLRGFRTSGIGLLHDRTDIGWIGCALQQCLGELLVREDERGWASEDGDSYEAMMDLSHRLTSDLYG